MPKKVKTCETTGKAAGFHGRHIMRHIFHQIPDSDLRSGEHARLRALLGAPRGQREGKAAGNAAIAPLRPHLGCFPRGAENGAQRRRAPRTKIDRFGSFCSRPLSTFSVLPAFNC